MGSSTFQFAEETVVITGASSGIGRAIACRFGEAGATVINADIEEEPNDAKATRPTHERIQDDGGDAHFVETDVSDPDDLEFAIDAARAFGGVDIMVNNAGIHITESVLDLTEAQFDRIHEVNVKGCLFGCQAAARDMRDRGVCGSILNMASISSTMAKPRQIAYESTKGAVKMITRSAAIELAPDIRVNALAPGRTATEFGASTAAEKAASVADQSMLKPVPMNRVGQPGDLTGAALFLASEDASYITGEMVYVDGGYHTI